MSTQKKKKKTTVEWNYMFPPYIVLFALMSKIIMFWFDNSFYSYKSYDYISNLIQRFELNRECVPNIVLLLNKLKIISDVAHDS